MKDKEENRRTVIRLIVFIIFMAVSASVICFTANFMSELNRINRAAVQDQEHVREIWAGLSVRSEMFFRKPKSLGIDDLLFLSAILSIFITLKIDRNYITHHLDIEGNDRWAKKREMKKEFIVVPEKKIENTEQSGSLLACINHRFYIDPKNNHNLIIGTTGSGKSQTHVMQLIRLMMSGQDKQSLIINDPKGEILENTANIAKSNDYNILILNLRDTARSSRWNPLTFAINEYKYCRQNNLDMSKITEYLDTMIQTLTYNPKSDPIWPSSAKSLLKAVILYMIETGYENKCLDKVNLPSAYQLFLEYGKEEMTVQDGVAMPKNKLDTLFKSLPAGSLAKAAYATTSFATGEMKSSICATLADNIEIFGTDTGIVRLTTGNDIDLEALLNDTRPFVIYMIVPDDRPTRHVLASMFINQCYLTMVEYIFKNRLQGLERRVNMILDEFGNMVRIPGMDNKITVSRSRNIGWYLYVQGLNQLDAKYEQEAKTIRENCANWIYIYSGDPETNEFISKILGTKTVEYKTYSGKLSDELSENQSYKGKQLKSPTELSVLEYGETIVKHHRMYPIMSKFDFYYKLKIRKVSIDDIPLNSERCNISDWLFPFRYFDEAIEAIECPADINPNEPSVPFRAEESQSFNNSFFGNDRYNRKSIAGSPIKLAIEEADSKSGGEFSSYLAENNIDQCIILLNRFKIKRSLNPQALELLQGYLENRK